MKSTPTFCLVIGFQKNVLNYCDYNKFVNVIKF